MWTLPRHDLTRCVSQAQPLPPHMDSTPSRNARPDRLYCVCRQPHGEREMIECDRCGEWYHFDCLGLDPAAVAETHAFFCPDCAPAGATIPIRPTPRKDMASSLPAGMLLHARATHSSPHVLDRSHDIDDDEDDDESSAARAKPHRKRAKQRDDSDEDFVPDDGRTALRKLALHSPAARADPRRRRTTSLTLHHDSWMLPRT